MRSRPTITDVAKLCGVTPATVSRVLNGKSKFSASEAVREKILTTARKLGYVPDLAARNLNRQTTNIIGIFASPQIHVGEGIYESILEGIAEVTHASEYDVFFDLSANLKHAVPFWRFDGAILLQSPRPETVRELDRRRVPYVCVNEKCGTPVGQVLADDVMGTARAVDHLYQLGHRKIAYANARATYLTHYSVPERYETLLELIQQRGMELAPGHDVPFYSAAEFLRDVIINGKATAILSYDHRIAVTLMGAAPLVNLKAPDDFSLVCFNDVFPASLLTPALTVVGVSGRDMGRIGADLLLNALTSETEKPGGATKEIRVPEDLIVRGSSAPPKHVKTETPS